MENNRSTWLQMLFNEHWESLPQFSPFRIKVLPCDFRLNDVFRWAFSFLLKAALIVCALLWICSISVGGCQNRSACDKSSSSNISWAQQLSYWFATSPVRTAVTCQPLCSYQIKDFFILPFWQINEDWYDLTSCVRKWAAAVVQFLIKFVCRFLFMIFTQ